MPASDAGAGAVAVVEVEAEAEAAAAAEGSAGGSRWSSPVPEGDAGADQLLLTRLLNIFYWPGIASTLRFFPSFLFFWCFFLNLKIF